MRQLILDEILGSVAERKVFILDSRALRIMSNVLQQKEIDGKYNLASIQDINSISYGQNGSTRSCLN